MLSSRFQLIQVDTVAEAKAMLQSNAVDMIILDISLSGKLDGLNLAEYIRQEKKDSRLPILAVTAHTSTVDEEKTFHAGCNRFLPKPFTQEKLLASIDELAEAKS